MALLLPSMATAADIVTPALVYGGGNLADYVSSVHALRRGGVESGPIAKHSLVGAKLGSAIVLTAIDLKLQKKGKKKEAWILRGIAIVGYAAMSIRNHGAAR